MLEHIREIAGMEGVAIVHRWRKSGSPSAVVMRGGRRYAWRPSGALRTHGPVRNIRAVNVLCTSFPRRLRRTVRSRAARIVVYVLALALTAANVAAAAMPPMSMA